MFKVISAWRRLTGEKCPIPSARVHGPSARGVGEGVLAAGCTSCLGSQLFALSVRGFQNGKSIFCVLSWVEILTMSIF